MREPNHYQSLHILTYLIRTKIYVLATIVLQPTLRLKKLGPRGLRNYSKAAQLWQSWYSVPGCLASVTVLLGTIVNHIFCFFMAMLFCHDKY